jgi:betaine-aldehyde dehydrogenase
MTTTVGIGAWNYPLQSAVWKSAPALAFGNSMVYKPSEYTPSTALRLAEIYQMAGVPDGTFSVVLGDGVNVGRALVEDHRTAKISFTGGIDAGRDVYERAAKNFKRVTLELGGKSPLIIFEDCCRRTDDDDTNRDDRHPLDVVVDAAMAANWLSSGQVCSNGTRVFVHSTIMDAFVERLVEKTRSLKIGDPRDSTTDIGPMISQSQMEKVMEYIRIGVEEDGATLLYGGNRLFLPQPDDGRHDQKKGGGGYYLEPAIFVNCHDSMKIVREEVFGMVMSILPFETEDEVVRRANDTSYGLAAGVYTNDIRRAHRVVGNLNAGITWINNYNVAPVELPWGNGFKNSSIGSENGLAGVDAWTRLKSVYVEMNWIIVNEQQQRWIEMTVVVVVVVAIALVGLESI